jgi:hypothetical protein
LRSRSEQRTLTDWPRRLSVSASGRSQVLIHEVRPIHDSIQAAFALLVVTQAAHSVEEYLGRLWETFPPARFLTGLVSQDQEWGFLALNVGLAAFGVWCLMWPIHRDWPSASLLAWIWVTIEVINGVGHPLWSLRMGGYTPGVATAPALLVIALYLGRQLRTVATPSSAPV